MSRNKVAAMRLEGCFDIKIIGGKYTVEHDGSADATAIDMVNTSKVEMIDVVANVINHQQLKLLQEIEQLLIQQRNNNQEINQKIDEAVRSIELLRNASQDTITNSVSDLILKLVPLSELGINVLEIIQALSNAF